MVLDHTPIGIDSAQVLLYSLMTRLAQTPVAAFGGIKAKEKEGDAMERRDMMTHHLQHTTDGATEPVRLSLSLDASSSRSPA